MAVIATNPAAKKPRKVRALTAEQLIMKHVKKLGELEAKCKKARADVPEELRERVHAVVGALIAGH